MPEPPMMPRMDFVMAFLPRSPCCRGPHNSTDMRNCQIAEPRTSIRCRDIAGRIRSLDFVNRYVAIAGLIPLHVRIGTPAPTLLSSGTNAGLHRAGTNDDFQ